MTDGGGGDENDRSGTKKSVQNSEWLLFLRKAFMHLSAGARAESTKAAKPHEKTVSFDRETVFTYIKQTPVQTPR